MTCNQILEWLIHNQKSKSNPTYLILKLGPRKTKSVLNILKETQTN